METVYLTARADEEGHLTLDLPASMKGRELRVTVVAEEPNLWDGASRATNSDTLSASESVSSEPSQTRPTNYP